MLKVVARQAVRLVDALIGELKEEKIEKEWKFLAEKLKSGDYQKNIDEINKRATEKNI